VWKYVPAGTAPGQIDIEVPVPGWGPPDGGPGPRPGIPGGPAPNANEWRSVVAAGDPARKRPLEGATVTLYEMPHAGVKGLTVESLQHGKVLATTTTDKNGEFVFPKAAAAAVRMVYRQGRLPAHVRRRGKRRRDGEFQIWPQRQRPVDRERGGQEQPAGECEGAPRGDRSRSTSVPPGPDPAVRRRRSKA